MTGRRELVAVVLGCLAGAALLLIAGGRTWATVVRPAPFHGTVAVTGHQLTAVTTAVGLLGLAAVAGVLATRSWGRRAAGLALVVAGLAAAVVSATAGDAAGARTAADLTGARVPVSFTGWRWAAVAGAALLVLAGAAVVARGRRWPGMGARYEAPGEPAAAPAAQAVDPDVSAWEALDRGEDPTVGHDRQ
ncbi:MAG TPA: Trp biosynthesis-associated membrane protein [Mycobacteriales bacterium]|nr:Trp biosynthesis-associated membrane protein [Mycobacteriales bacterium]